MSTEDDWDGILSDDELELLGHLSPLRKTRVGGCIQNVLADKLDKNSSSVTRMLDRLEELRLLRREVVDNRRNPRHIEVMRFHGKRGPPKLVMITDRGDDYWRWNKARRPQPDGTARMSVLDSKEFRGCVELILAESPPIDAFRMAKAVLGNGPCANYVEAIEIIEGALDDRRCDRAMRVALYTLLADILELGGGSIILDHQWWYLFSWGRIPGTDEVLLREFLEGTFSIDWGKPAEIKKTDNDDAITISLGKDVVEIRLDRNRDRAILKPSDRGTRELIVREEHGELNIYRCRNIKERLLGRLRREMADTLAGSTRCTLLFDWGKVKDEHREALMGVMRKHGTEWRDGSVIEYHEGFCEEESPGFVTSDIVVFDGEYPYFILSMDDVSGGVFVDGDFSSPRYVERWDGESFSIYENWLVPDVVGALYRSIRWICAPGHFEWILHICLRAMEPPAMIFMVSDESRRTVNDIIEDVVRREPSLGEIVQDRLGEYIEQCERERERHSKLLQLDVTGMQTREVERLFRSIRNYKEILISLGLLPIPCAETDLGDDRTTSHPE